MLSRLLLIYAVVEVAVIFALVSTIGWGWTLLVLLATFLLGWGVLAPLAGSQLIDRIGRLRSGLTDPRRGHRPLAGDAASDGALVTLATVLVLIPGVVSTAFGVLLLLPPVRSVAGPGLTAVAVRRFQRRVPGISYATAFRTDFDSAEDRDYIDGEVVDVQDFRRPAAPSDAVRGGFPGRPDWD